ncbi:hypothetical protein A3K89_12495 [Rhodococcoides kyotonense]|uniref:Uncharacterized protein n=1 Tax=Rhodococcoides kyotonense TaxID=398843 RepID=A0A177Y7D1_9NOCA|nr:hypothetical protein A3K89_12495 [Rhodococcus kyotonensis]
MNVVGHAHSPGDGLGDETGTAVHGFVDHKGVHRFLLTKTSIEWHVFVFRTFDDRGSAECTRES